MRKILLILSMFLGLSCFAQNVATTWNPSTSPVNGYRIYANGSILTNLNTTSFNIPFSLLSINVTNTFNVTAFNGIGESAAANPIKIYRPLAPTSLSYSNNIDGSVLLKWPVHPSTAINAYNVFVGTNVNNLSKLTSVAGRNITNYTITADNLSDNVTNYVALSAYNTVLDPVNTTVESPNSTILNVVLPPAPPTNLRVIGIVP
jgi:hypothetical protein